MGAGLGFRVLGLCFGVLGFRVRVARFRGNVLMENPSA